MPVVKYIFYYTTEHPAVVTAAETYFRDRATLHLQQNKFARRFGGAAMHSAMDDRLVGVAFTADKPPKKGDITLWTLPDKHGMRRPRPKGGGAEGDKLRAEWQKHWPTGSILENPLLLELDLPQFHPGRSMGYAVKKGVFYLCTSEPASDKRLTEVPASVYVGAVS